MSAVGKILGSIVQIVFIAVGFALLGPIGAFIGSIVGSFANAAIQSLFNKSTNIAQASANVRIPEPIRWINAGECKQGGAVLFADFASNGDLWFLVVHSDSIMGTRQKIYFDDVEVIIDGSNAVQTKEFRLTSKFEPVTSDGAGNTFVWIYTTTYTETNPTPPGISQLIAAFSGRWTTDHKLVGTTYSVIRMLGMKVEDRYKLYKFRGPLGMGEPSVAIVADWSHCYDPRDGTQTLGTPSTYKFTRNSALIWAWFRTHRYGRNKSTSSINWAQVALMATICDQTVTGIVGSHVRYQCDASISEDMSRNDAEQAILMTMDAQLVFDATGLCWPRPGYYYAPTLALNRNRDIVAMESVEAQNGESETQGVVIRYTDPDAKYTTQPSAAWLNPNYYVVGQSPTFLQIDGHFIQDHNQAMRIAKAIGMRMQPLYKLAPTIGLRGLKASQERICNLNYDNTFSGDQEICTQVQLDGAGIFCTFGTVPVDANRWELLAGEELPKPVVDGSSTSTGTPDLPVISSLTIVDGLIQVVFATPTRVDVTYQIQYILTSLVGSGNWVDMSVQMTDLTAFSGPVDPGVSYSVRYRSLLTSGLNSAWSITSTITPGTAIDPPTMGSATGAVGHSTLGYRNPNSASFNHVDIKRNTTSTLGTASTIATNQYGALGAVQSYTDTVAAGTYYYWFIAYATDGTPSSAHGPFSDTVT